MEEPRVEFSSENPLSDKPATVKIFLGDKLVKEITGTVTQKQGMDGGYYPCVVLTEKPI